MRVRVHVRAALLRGISSAPESLVSPRMCSLALFSGVSQMRLSLLIYSQRTGS